MSGDLLNGWGTDIWGPSLTLGADQSFVTDKTAQTVSTNALDSMTPVQQPTQDDAFGWLKDIAKTGVNYLIQNLIQKDAQKNQVMPAQDYARVAQATAQNQQAKASAMPSGMVMVALLLVGGVVLVKVLKD